MAKVTETRVKITLTDAMSGPLRKIEARPTLQTKLSAILPAVLKALPLLVLRLLPVRLVLQHLATAFPSWLALACNLIRRWRQMPSVWQAS